MKVLVLHPQIMPDNPLLSFLKDKGIAVLLANDSVESEQLIRLHGVSIDLVLVHRENDEARSALTWIQNLRKKTLYADLPYILSTSEWNPSQCAKHQNEAGGANAYLQFPFSPAEVARVVESILGPAVPASRVEKRGTFSRTAPKRDTVSGLVLEETDDIFKADVSLREESSIKLMMALDSMPMPEDEPGAPLTGLGLELSSESGGGTLQLESSSGGAMGESSSSNGFVSEPLEIEAMGNGLLIESESLLDENDSLNDSVEFALEGDSKSELSQIEVAARSEASKKRKEILERLQVPVEHLPFDEEEGVSATQMIAIEGNEGGHEDYQNLFQPSAVVESHEVSRVDLSRDVVQAPPSPIVSFAPNSNNDSEATRPSMEREAEDEVAAELPYLFGAPSPKAATPVYSETSASSMSDVPLYQASPLVDVVIPGSGGSANTDIDVLKKYLLLREQDVMALSTQLKSLREHQKNMEMSLQMEKARSAELEHLAQNLKKKEADLETQLKLARESYDREIEGAQFQLKVKQDRARLLESQVKEASAEIESIRERVKHDLRKIRVREKELENKLELLKRDSDALLGARDQKIIELKRKLDLVEFNMELVQEQYAKERETAQSYREKLERAAKAMRLAEGMLEPAPQPAAPTSAKSPSPSENLRKAS